ncbi:oxygenase MpaB family protein, partial [Streptomyces calidiresistens]|uniref:oxygenase MpaB family protein n=1 Tax=Streptomyces calidiresistens TaxID=1485586 RepID=UPI001E5D6F43
LPPLGPLPAVGLFGPDTVSWRVHADPAMGLAGLRALLLQALHPLAMAGVSRHSTYREDPWGRLYRTAFFIGAVTYGTGPEAREVIDRVRRVHTTVHGTDPETGLPYHAADPDLLVWVHTSEVSSFLEVTTRAGLRLTPAEADRYLAEQAGVARLVGVPEGHPLPEDTAALERYLEDMRSGGTLRAGPAALEAARFAFAPPLPGAARGARPLWAGLIRLAVALLPPWARRMYGLPAHPAVDRLAGAGARSLRRCLISLPRPLREGPHLRDARVRRREFPGTAGADSGEIFELGASVPAPPPEARDEPPHHGGERREGEK